MLESPCIWPHKQEISVFVACGCAQLLNALYHTTPHTHTHIYVVLERWQEQMEDPFMAQYYAGLFTLVT
jgi:hypothetical protein